MKKIIIKNKYKYNFPNLLYLVFGLTPLANSSPLHMEHGRPTSSTIAILHEEQLFPS